MSVHTELLAELTKYKGGEFVPVWETTRGPFVLEYDAPFDEYRWWCEAADDEEECRVFHAHAHIENAAWRAVRDWCKELRLVMIVSDLLLDGPVGIGHISYPSIDPTKMATGPDDATALLAMMRHINGATA